MGSLQGLTEFLPISSSGHLVLVPYVFNWNYQGKAFDVALHAGTAFAIVVFFWRDWLDIFKKAFSRRARVEGETIKKYPDNILWQILVASIPAVIVGLLLDKFAADYLNSTLFVTANLALFGILLWYVDKKSKSDLTPQKLTYKKSFLIGLSQSLALIPGVSRSGITLTAARWMGMPRAEAARFSFLLATPTIVGAFLMKIATIEKGGLDITFWLGVIAATVFGLLAIKFLLNYLKNSDLSIFMWYRIIAALIVLGIYLARLN
ncbi:MAG: undecaprenyl-diphosphate phosphatase [Patescibacteria group bacterium]